MHGNRAWMATDNWPSPSDEWQRKSENILTWRTKSEIIPPCFEVGYVSSSFLHGAVLWFSTPPR